MRKFISVRKEENGGRRSPVREGKGPARSADLLRSSPDKVELRVDMKEIRNSIDLGREEASLMRSLMAALREVDDEDLYTR